jgi:hypothetical protein
MVGESVRVTEQARRGCLLLWGRSKTCRRLGQATRSSEEEGGVVEGPQAGHLIPTSEPRS